MPNAPDRPVVLVTGAAGAIGSALRDALADRYAVVGLDRSIPERDDGEWIEADLTADASVSAGMEQLARRVGTRLAAVVHLAAYFDFTGEENPLYEQVNVQGTRRLLRALQGFSVERLVYSGTMLVHEAGRPGEVITEVTPIAPGWAYPKSKAKAEQVIAGEAGDMPYVLLHLAGLYDDTTAVPTLAHQIARIYERDIKSHLYAGDTRAGQSMVHLDDMLDAIRRAVDRRDRLPPRVTILVGEPEAVPYAELQRLIGHAVHGRDDWQTLDVPKPLAKVGAWLEEQAEPLVPDALDHGEKPFIRPFMIDMASDHYALDVSRARELLGWEPRHSIRTTLPSIVAALKHDPLAWYAANKLTPPAWLETAAEQSDSPEALRARAEQSFRSAHGRTVWAHFLTAALGTWLLTSPPTLGYLGTPLAWSDMAAGAVLLLAGLLALSPQLSWARWLTAVTGIWLMGAPLVFWSESAAGYLNGSLVGAVATGIAIAMPPIPGIDPVARVSGPTIPKGWDYTPSAWTQRLLVIALAFIGLYFSRYLAAYQLEQIPGAWDPFFAGGPEPKNGTEEIVTSSVSEAFPVPDAGLGALTYLLEILTGLAGSARRWRTMPWLVVLFGVMIVPLGAVSIFFIIIQPILLGTWCTLCLLGAAAMLVQIPYSADELVATGQFLLRRRRAGKSVLRVFFTGDTDEDDGRRLDDEFARPPRAVLADVVGGGVGTPWNLMACIAIGLWLMFTRLTLGSSGDMANADHLVGALVVTASVTALAEVARIVRFANVPLGLALLVTPFWLDADALQTIASLACGVALVLLSLRRGPVRSHYAGWDRYVV